MTQQTSINKGQLVQQKGAQPPRMGPALRLAMKLRLEEGLTILDACRKAKLSEAGWYAAMKRPAVAAHFDQLSIQFCQTVERRRAQYKARAIEVAADLMERAQSEAVRMRAVEFFAGESKQALVNIAVNQAPAGYSYSPPKDQASSGQSVQDAEIVEQSPDDVPEA